MTPSLASQATNEGSATRTRYSPGRARIAPPCLACSTSFASFRRNTRATTTSSIDRADDDRAHQHRMVVGQLELALEGARDAREQVDVDERPGEREEDLLDEHPPEHARQGRAGDDRGVHQQHRERTDVGRQEAVERDAGGVGREHLAVRHRRRGIGGAQDREPAQRGKRRLHRLQRPAGREIAEPDPRERVPDVREPAGDVDAEQLQQRNDDRDPGEPSQDAGEPRSP